MTLKEKKEMDDAFKKAQKPWAKLYDKVNIHLFFICFQGTTPWN